MTDTVYINLSQICEANEITSCRLLNSSHKLTEKKRRGKRERNRQTKQTGALILSETLALYKSFTYLLSYLQSDKGTDKQNEAKLYRCRGDISRASVDNEQSYSSQCQQSETRLNLASHRQCDSI